MTGLSDNDIGTRDRILRLIIEKGPVTSAELAKELVLTAAAVRRHLAQLEIDGQITEYEGVASKPARRGRPSRRYVATGEGQATFGDSYGDVATQALDFLYDSLGDDGIWKFAQQRIHGLEARYRDAIASSGDDLEARAHALARVLTQDGYAASIRKGPGVTRFNCVRATVQFRKWQLHTRRCARQKTQAFHRLLGVHVQRLATLAGGEHVCTLTIPLVSRTRETTPTWKDSHDTNPA